MSRMIDRIYAHGVTMQTMAGTAHVPGDTLAASLPNAPFPQAEVFAVDNVAEYLYAETDQEEWEINTDFPCLALPAPVSWFETRRPSRLLSRMPGQSRPAEAFPLSWGMLATMTSLEGFLARIQDPAMVIEQCTRQLRAYEPTLCRLRDQHQPGAPLRLEDFTEDDRTVLMAAWACERTRQRLLDGESPGALWGDSMETINPGRQPAFVLECMMFVESVKTQIHGPIFVAMVHLDQYGKALKTAFPDGHQDYVQLLTYVNYSVEQQRAMAGGLRSLLFPFWLAISFLHCKNVQAHRHAPGTEGHPALRKRFHGVPRAVYKTLDILPMKEILRTEGRSGEVGLQRALHIVRGHFADYRDGAGLFGRHHGLFWRDMHVRGTSNAGVIVKDYEVHGPKKLVDTRAVPHA